MGWGWKASLAAAGWNGMLQKQEVQSQRHSVELKVHLYQRTDKERLGSREYSPVRRPGYEHQTEPKRLWANTNPEAVYRGGAFYISCWEGETERAFITESSGTAQDWVLAFHNTQWQVCGLKETYSNMQPVGSGGIWQTGSQKPTHSYHSSGAVIHTGHCSFQ